MEIAGEKVELLPEKLIFLPQRQTLLVADTHFGKAATFRKAGIPVPNGTTAAMLQTLSNVIDRCSVQRLIVLGDFVHSSVAASADFELELFEWRSKYAALDLRLVPGNHDCGRSKLFEELKLEISPEPFAEPPFAFCHFHQASADSKSFAFAGHIHPAIQVRDFGNIRSKFPCFAFAKTYALLPAFGHFTGCHVVLRSDFEQVFAVVEDRVIEIA